MQGPLAHPSEPTCPCCLPALGGFSGVTPHEGSTTSLTQRLGRGGRAGVRGRPGQGPATRWGLAVSTVTVIGGLVVAAVPATVCRGPVPLSWYVPVQVVVTVRR